MTRLARLCTLLVCYAGLNACNPDDPCDPGYVADHGACLRQARPKSDNDAGAPSTDAATPFDVNDFGYTCATDADCGGSAPSCGAPRLPICTAVNCLTGMGRCPDTWNCLDVSSWTPDPKIQSVCVNF